MQVRDRNTMEQIAPKFFAWILRIIVQEKDIWKYFIGKLITLSASDESRGQCFWRAGGLC